MNNIVLRLKWRSGQSDWLLCNSVYASHMSALHRSSKPDDVYEDEDEDEDKDEDEDEDEDKDEDEWCEMNRLL